MSSISSVSLSDTYRLIQLARETARVQGRTDQAERLSPVVKEMRELVKPEAKPASTTGVGGVMQQTGFQKLLEISRAGNELNQIGRAMPSANSIMERNRMIMAMSSASMTDVEIARQMGMTRDEVRMVVSINRHANSNNPIGVGL